MVESERRYQGLVELFARGCWIAYFSTYGQHTISSHEYATICVGEDNRRMIADFYDDFLLYLYASARAASHFSQFDIEVW